MFRLCALTGAVGAVAGGAPGVGRAAAEPMAEAGTQGAIHCRDQTPCNTAAVTRGTQGGRRAVAVAAGIPVKAVLPRFCGTVAKRRGRIALLVRNAASNPCTGASAR